MAQERIRASIGTASLLGLAVCRLAVPPTTAYLLTYIARKCSANCAFCPQAKGSTSVGSYLSRVEWPVFKTNEVLEALSHNRSMQRICLQSLNFPERFEYALDVVERMMQVCPRPISLCTPPIASNQMKELDDSGLDRICFALDAADPENFDRIKGRGAGGPYLWDEHLSSLERALQVFGPGRVTTHLIQGLGESEQSLICMIQRFKDSGIFPSLFALTPIKGTAMAKMSPPAIPSYRRVQVARYLIMKALLRSEEMSFENGRLTGFPIDSGDLMKMLLDGHAFRTSGCPSCNRPYYNESPKGPIYNYPRELMRKEIEEAFSHLESLK